MQLSYDFIIYRVSGNIDQKAIYNLMSTATVRFRHLSITGNLRNQIKPWPSL
jgi:hypothetical protein